MLNKRLINTGAAAAAFDPLQNFETVTYTGNGGTQKITGYIRKGAAFNGSSSYVRLPNNLINNISPQAFSVSFWINPSVYASSRGVLGAYGYTPGVNYGWVIYLNSNLIRFLSYSSNGNMDFSSSAAIPLNTWTHVVVTYDSSNCTIYLNGSNDNSVSTPGNRTYTSNHPYVLGANDDTGTIVGHITAKLDQVRIFDKALSTDNNGVNEIDELYRETYDSSTKSTTDIFNDGSGVALYELDEDANDTGTTPYGTGAIDSGQSAVFNGSSSGITTTQSWGRTNDFSFSLWVKDAGGTHSASGDKAVLLNYNNDYIVLNYEVDNKAFSIPLHNGTTQLGICTTGNNFDTSTWRNIVVTNKLTGSGAGMYMYVDGTLVSSVVGEATQRRDVSAGSGTVFGFNTANTTNDLRYVGKIDQIRIFDTALSASDVEALVSETNVPTANLVAHYKLDGNANDETGSYNGTPTNITYSDPAEFPLIAYNGTPTNVNFLGMAFQPDFVWIKNRDSIASNFIHDSVRGVDNDHYRTLITNGTFGESTFNQSWHDLYGRLSNISSNGFTINQGSVTNDTSYNNSGDDYVAWCWKAGGAAVSNTDGTITSQVSANVDSGFSIVAYTGNGIAGATVGHGLSSAPEIVITKGRSFSDVWLITGTAIGDNDTNYLLFNTSAMGSSSTVGSSNATTLDIGTSTASNTSGQTFISYCFHSVDGYQKVGSYTGTGASANKITTGFKPRFLLVKQTNTTRNWYIIDSTRNPSDPRNLLLIPNSSASEFAGTGDVYCDFLSDGFEWTSSAGDAFNQSGGEYIYLAIA